jgi:hypothetical protein
MRLFNQTKNSLSWSMGGVAYSCEPWGAVEVSDELVDIARRRGLPLDVAPVAPEARAKQRISDEQEASKENATIALKGKLDDAVAALEAAKGELGSVQVALSEARNQLRLSGEENARLQTQVGSLLADKEAAEQLLAHESARATDAEARAIRAEALVTEPPRASAKGKSARAD